MFLMIRNVKLITLFKQMFKLVSVSPTQLKKTKDKDQSDQLSHQDESENMANVSSIGGFICVPKSMKMEVTANMFWLCLEDTKKRMDPRNFEDNP